MIAIIAILTLLIIILILYINHSSKSKYEHGFRNYGRGFRDSGRTYGERWYTGNGYGEFTKPIDDNYFKYYFTLIPELQAKFVENMARQHSRLAPKYISICKKDIKCNNFLKLPY